MFSHRYNKGDEFLANPLISFDIIRDPMYKYSRVAQENYLNVPVLAFILAWFCRNSNGRQFAQHKCAENQNADFCEKMNVEMKEMVGLATDYIHRECSLYAYL